MGLQERESERWQRSRGGVASAYCAQASMRMCDAIGLWHGLEAREFGRVEPEPTPAEGGMWDGRVDDRVSIRKLS